MKVLYVASEAYPFAMSGGLADVAGALPKALRRRMVGCRIVMPLYSSVPEELKREMKFIKSIVVPVSWRMQYCGIFEAKKDGVIYYLIDNQYYFKRDGLYGHYDDAERFAFFSRAVLEILPHIDFTPDIIHCNDWQTGFIPLFLKAHYQSQGLYGNAKTMLTIHNIEYQGKANPDFKDEVLGVGDEWTNIITFDGCVNALKTGIVLCDKITTVSKTYSHEICHAYFAHGLENILRENSYKLTGVVNGIDDKLYNPKTDNVIKEKFSPSDLSGKDACKKHLQEKLGLEVNPDIPVVAMISRLVSHKGLDLVEYVAHELVNLGIELVVLGTGEKKYEDLFNFMAYSYPGKVSSNITFSSSLAKEIYSGSDFFLMPSKSEPCGLSQLIAMRYASIPIVRETGGLVDTVPPINPETVDGAGFTFKGYNAHDMLGAVSRAVDFYRYDKDKLKAIKKKISSYDLGWKTSAQKYMDIYSSI